MSSDLALDSNILAKIAQKPVAVAVSGGSDSLALTLLLRAQSDVKLSIVTVDHGLRPEAQVEAQYVAEFCAERNLPHQMLKVEVSQQGNIAANAREARYQAMRNYCAESGNEALLLGHTKNDQIETFLLNAMRGSGIDGLASIPPISPDGFFMRPMLALKRVDLQNYLAAQNIKYINDPSNDDITRERIRLRQWIAEGEKQGLEFSGILKTISNASRSKSFLQDETQNIVQRMVQFSPLEIEAKIERENLTNLHEEIAFRLLAKLCQFYGQSPYKPRLSAIEDLYHALFHEKGGRVLEKTEFQWDGKYLRAFAEPANLPTSKFSNHWYRFSIAPSTDLDGSTAYIAPLQNHEMLKEIAGQYGISAKAAKSWPAIYLRNETGGEFISAQIENFLVNAPFAL